MLVGFIFDGTMKKELIKVIGVCSLRQKLDLSTGDEKFYKHVIVKIMCCYKIHYKLLYTLSIQNQQIGLR